MHGIVLSDTAGSLSGSEQRVESRGNVRQSTVLGYAPLSIWHWDTSGLGLFSFERKNRGVNEPIRKFFFKRIRVEQFFHAGIEQPLGGLRSWC